MSSAEDGEYAATWTTTSYHIEARYIDTANPADSAAAVQVDVGSQFSEFSSVAMNGNSLFAVAYEQVDPNSDSDTIINARVYDASSSPVPESLPVRIASETSSDIPVIAIDGAGDVAVSWVDGTFPDTHQWMRVVSHEDWQTVGSIIQVDQVPWSGGIELGTSSISMNDDGDLIVAYSSVGHWYNGATEIIDYHTTDGMGHYGVDTYNGGPDDREFTGLIDFLDS